jgi:aspartate aminotransferase-like enzyme
MKKTLLLLPGPVPVAQPVLEAMAWPMINHRGPEFAELLARLERGMKPLFGTSADVFSLGSSGTGGLETAVANCFGPGDHLLSAPVGVFGKRLAEIARTYGCSVEVLDTPLGAAVDPEALRGRLERDEARTIKGVLLTHNETSTGVQNDMAALSAAVRQHGALTIVDSVSGLGASPFEMDAWGYDVVVTASQKALAVPPGAAMIAVSERAWTAIGTSAAPRYYFDLAKAREFARKGQTPWTPPISIFYALAVALERYHTDGLEENFNRHARYARGLRSAPVHDLLPRGRALGHGCRRRAAERYRRCDAAQDVARNLWRRALGRSRRTHRQDRALRDHGRRERGRSARRGRRGGTDAR